MTFDIFRIDWILVDTIIIILLMLFLVSVKIFKGTHRWRKIISNEAIVKHSYKGSRIEVDSNILKIKNWYLLENKKFQKETIKKPTLILIRTNRKRILMNVLSEGLCSYGFNIINLKLNIRIRKDGDYLNKEFQEEVKNGIFSIISYCNQESKTLNSKYIVLSYTESKISYNSLLNDLNNFGLILINPKINSRTRNSFLTIKKRENPNSYLQLIFSQKSTLFRENVNQRRFLAEVLPTHKDIFKYITVAKAKRSFKYYETILLSIIIDVIEN